MTDECPVMSYIDKTYIYVFFQFVIVDMIILKIYIVFGKQIQYYKEHTLPYYTYGYKNI